MPTLPTKSWCDVNLFDFRTTLYGNLCRRYLLQVGNSVSVSSVLSFRISHTGLGIEPMFYRPTFRFYDVLQATTTQKLHVAYNNTRCLETRCQNHMQRMTTNITSRHLQLIITWFNFVEHLKTNYWNNGHHNKIIYHIIK